MTGRLIEKLFQQDRLTALLASVAAQRAERAIEVDHRVASLQTEVTETEEKLKRLYKMVEDGVTDLDDLLKDRIGSFMLARERAVTALDRIRSQVAAPTSFEPEALERFGRMMRGNITSGEISFRKAYIQSVIDRVEVDDNVIRIVGDKATLEQALAGRSIASVGVRRCGPKWRDLREPQ